MPNSKSPQQRKKEANACFGLAACLGAANTFIGVSVGATCPICYVAIPALVGAGLLEHRQARKFEATEDDENRT